MNITSLIRKAEVSAEINRTARASEKVSRVVRILEDVCSDPERYVRILRSQMGREEHMLFTYNQIHRWAVDGNRDACEVMFEYIRQERADGVPDSVSDEEINELWQQGISLGRVISANPFKLEFFYKGKGKQGSKPWVSLNHWARAIRAVSEEGVHNEAMEGLLYEALVGFHEKFFGLGEMEETFEMVSTGFMEAFYGTEAEA